MKVKIKVEKEVEIKTLKVDAGVRYWEDSIVNGIEDTNGDLIPFRVDDRWRPVINIDTGIVINWPRGMTAKISYNICDDGNYYILDNNGDVVLSIEDDYVPRILCPICFLLSVSRSIFI